MSTRESAAAPKIAAPAAPTARSIQLRLPAAMKKLLAEEAAESTVPKFLEVQPRREAANRGLRIEIF